jgi:hypothetical protein
MAEQTLQLPASQPNRFYETLHRLILVWENPLSAGILTGIIFIGFASLLGPPWRSSTTPYFNYLADAFLHGQSALRLIPPTVSDLSLYQGNYYLYWGPMTAFLIMPFVALFGIQVSDLLQAAVYGGINAGLCALLLRMVVRRNWVNLSATQRGMLALFFALGTPQTSLPAVGGVTYLLQMETLTWSLLAFVTTFAFENKKAFFWTGFAIAGVMLSRLSALAIIIFLVWYLIRQHWNQGLRRLFSYCVVGVLPVAVAVCFLLIYNQARFGSPLDNGVNYHLMIDAIKDNYRLYGLFSLHYVPMNFFLGYLFYPPAQKISEGAFTLMGGSLFLLSPVLFAGLYELWQGRKDTTTWMLLGSFIIGNIPAMIIIAPGSVHFGPRYLLDAILPLFLLSIRGIKNWPGWLVLLLVFISVIHYLVGALAVIYSPYFR